ncbi:Leucine Rich Repeat [Seminavis robusta]|uniref:Leucine Rich Repeat n=1 Tax=Seminavis robusta TaxID=568900 RepID=A0A9N8EI03_9STRA|nr:Leucine Rich Repeat [Seminavis robusta]|eukprot:Sro984_g227910.1 Leucine Rich Repeat (1098) ;mRNA; f:17006-20785
MSDNDEQKPNAKANDNDKRTHGVLVDVDEVVVVDVDEAGAGASLQQASQEEEAENLLVQRQQEEMLRLQERQAMERKQFQEAKKLQQRHNDTSSTADNVNRDSASGATGNRPSLKSTATQAMTPSIRGINAAAVQAEPQVLAVERRASGTAQSAKEAQDHEDHALEIVAQQASRRKGLPRHHSNNSSTLKKSEHDQLQPSNRSLVANQEPNVVLAGEERRRSSVDVDAIYVAEMVSKKAQEKQKPQAVGRNYSGSSRASTVSSVDIDVDDMEHFIVQEPDKPSIVARNCSTDTSNSNSNNSQANIEFLKRRESKLQSAERQKGSTKSGLKRFSSLSTASNITVTTSGSSDGTHPSSPFDGSSEIIDSARHIIEGESPAARRRRSSENRRDRDEFEQKRQALPTSQIVMVAANNSLQLPTLKQGASSWEEMEKTGLTSSTTTTRMSSQKQPQQVQSYHSSSDSNIPVEHQSASSPVTTHPSNPPMETVQRPFLQEQLVVATLVEEDTTTNRSETDRNASCSSLAFDDSNPLPESARPPQEAPPPPPVSNNNLLGLQGDTADIDPSKIIVQAKPAEALDSVWDVLRDRNGRVLVCLLVVLIAAGVIGISIGLGGFLDSKGESGEVQQTSFGLGASQGTQQTPTTIEPIRDEPTAAPVVQIADTLAPTTHAPTTELQGAFASLLPSYTVDALHDPNSAQSKALKWLLVDHEPAVFASYSEDRLRQRFALATLYYATKGIGWRWKRFWLSTDPEIHECQWWSYYDHPESSGRDSPCNENMEYESLALSENYLKGTLPPEVALLTALKDIHLVADAFFGATSDEEKKENYISGQIPIPWMTSLSNLTTIDLGRNALTGSIPTEIGLMPELQIVQLRENLIGGTIPPSLFGLPNVKELWLFDNRLTGPIPTEVQFVTDSLRIFAAYSNRLTGTIPTELVSLTQLRQLKLESNQLVGKIPIDITYMTNLRSLHLFDNRLSGTIHTEFGRLSELKHFWIGKNRLTGTMPSELGSMVGLNNIGLGNNKLTGTIPVDLGNWSSILRTVLEFNDLTGSVPQELCSKASSNPVFFRVFVDCEEVQCGCLCCLCNCGLRSGGENRSLSEP